MQSRNFCRVRRQPALLRLGRRTIGTSSCAVVGWPSRIAGLVPPRARRFQQQPVVGRVHRLLHLRARDAARWRRCSAASSPRSSRRLHDEVWRSPWRQRLRQRHRPRHDDAGGVGTAGVAERAVAGGADAAARRWAPARGRRRRAAAGAVGDAAGGAAWARSGPGSRTPASSDRRARSGWPASGRPAEPRPLRNAAWRPADHPADTPAGRRPRGGARCRAACAGAHRPEAPRHVGTRPAARLWPRGSASIERAIAASASPARPSASRHSARYRCTSAAFAGPGVSSSASASSYAASRYERLRAVEGVLRLRGAGHRRRQGDRRHDLEQASGEHRIYCLMRLRLEVDADARRRALTSGSRSAAARRVRDAGGRFHACRSAGDRLPIGVSPMRSPSTKTSAHGRALMRQRRVGRVDPDGRRASRADRHVRSTSKPVSSLTKCSAWVPTGSITRFDVGRAQQPAFFEDPQRQRACPRSASRRCCRRSRRG